MSAPVLDIRGLHVRFATADGEVHAVRGIDCHVERGECLGVVGESGSGKSQTFLAAMGLLPSNARTEGVVEHGGRNLLALSSRELDQVRGDRVSMIFQDPLTSLTPHMTIGAQMRETLVAHRRLGRGEARERCLEWLERVALPEPERRLRQYPHELSGGMRQRVMIATAMLCEPALLIADEPTTALDVTIQAEILDLMEALRRDTGTAIVLITHDMGVVARLCDRMQVMRAGEYVEGGDVDAVFHAPTHVYTRALLDAVPRIDAPTLLERAADGRDGERPGGGIGAGRVPEDAPVDSGASGASTMDDSPVLHARDVVVTYRLPGRLFRAGAELRAVDGVGFGLGAGETLGIVGESGSGKSTLARAVLGLIPTEAGEIAWFGRPLTARTAEELRRARRDLSIVFQDPLASLDPAMTIGDSIAEPLRVAEPALRRDERRSRVRQAMERVGLDGALLNRYPHELSGGQNQRVGIARATITHPKVLICDEAVSALDVSVQARILELLAALKRELGLAMLFISHDLSVVRQVSDRVLVMYLGAVVELAPSEALFADPRHPYTCQLLSAVPLPDPRLERTRRRLRLRPSTAAPTEPAARFRFLPSRLEAAANALDDAASGTRSGAAPIGPAGDGALQMPVLRRHAPGHFVAEHDPIESLLLD